MLDEVFVMAMAWNDDHNHSAKPIAIVVPCKKAHYRHLALIIEMACQA